MEEEEEEVRVLRSLRNAFSSVSLEAIAAAYTEADGDPIAAAHFLTKGRSSTSCSSHTAIPRPQHLRSAHANPPSAAKVPFDYPSRSQLQDCHFPPLSTSPSSLHKAYCSSPQLANNIKLSSVDFSQKSIDHRKSGSLNGSCQPMSKSKPVIGCASFGPVCSARVRRVGETYKSFLNCPKDSFSSSGAGPAASCNATAQKHGQSKVDMFALEKKDAIQQEKVVEHVYSMLGDGFQLGIDYVRDVLGRCEGDVDKSMDILLNSCRISSIHVDTPRIEGSLRLSENNVDLDGTQSNYSIDFSIDANSDYDLDGLEMPSKRIEVDCEMNNLENRDNDKGNDMDITYASNKHSENLLFSQVMVNNYSSIKHIVKQLHHAYPSMEMQTLFEILQANNFNYSDAVQYLVQAGALAEAKSIGNVSSLSREVMESLFRGQPREVSSLENVKQRLHERGKQQKSQNYLTHPKAGIVQSNAFAIMKEIDRSYGKTYGSWDDYERHRISANQHWSTMKEYFQQAATAYQKGEYSRAGILSEKAQEHRKLAEEARKRAKNRLSSLNMMAFESDLNLDLHGQHLGAVRRLLKLHIYLLTTIPSIKTLTLVTDRQGFHSEGGRSKLESAVVSYLEKKGVDWVEVAPHCIKVRKSTVQCNDSLLGDDGEL